MRFILTLTAREFRSSWRRLLFFFLCIALGVGSVVALRSLIQNLTRAVGTDARALMTADIEVTSTNELTPVEVQKIEDAVNASTIVDGRNETINAAVMARPSDTSKGTAKFVELKGIEPPFPLVGNFMLADGKPFDFNLLTNNGAVVANILLEDLGVKIGDKIKIGESEFTIRGAFDEEPGGTSGFRLGARVFVEQKAFESAGLVKNSRVRRRILYRTTSDPTPLVKTLRDALKGTTVGVNSYREQQDNMSEQFERTENYLALTGLLILVLGGVGVWNVARAFVEQKRHTVAILKCLGANGNKVVTVYLLQIFVLGTIGSLFGVLLAQCALWLVKYRFAADLPERMTYSIAPSTAFQGLLLGVLISMLFSALPLMQIRNIKPRLLLRDENNAALKHLDRTKWLFGALTLIGLLGLAVWQAGSIKAGIFFLTGLAITASILYFAASILVWILRRFRRISSFSIGQAVNSLYRPGNQTRVILLAVGLGAFVVLGVQMMQSNLVREFDFTQNQKLPSLFIVDIQNSQISDLAAMITSRLDEAPEVIPTVRARIAYINGQPIDYENREVRRQQGQIGREFAITYRDILQPNETIVDGVWWPVKNDEPQVSVEADMARTLKLAAGDSITFDISGRQMTARVANIRKLDLRNTRTAFLFVFRSGTLEQAPQTFAASVLRHVPSTERQRLQRDLLDKFPNVQIFDVDDILAAVQKLIKNFVIAISFVGGFVMLSGILILIGSIGLTKSQRIYENAVLKTLGADRRILTTILIAEYSILGILAGIIGTAFATAMSYAVCHFLMSVKWEFDIAAAVGGIFITALIVTIVGVFASFDVLFRKPLSTLRSQ